MNVGLKTASRLSDTILTQSKMDMRLDLTFEKIDIARDKRGRRSNLLPEREKKETSGSQQQPTVSNTKREFPSRSQTLALATAKLVSQWIRISRSVSDSFFFLFVSDAAKDAGNVGTLD